MTTERPLEIGTDAIESISLELRRLLADVFTLYLKTKNFHWHMRGPHFRDYHLLLDEHAEQLFAMTDDIAERTRKLGGTTLKSIGDVTRNQRLRDDDEPLIAPIEMLMRLLSDNKTLTTYLRSAHELCERYNDVATAGLLENWIDQTERRVWFLVEIN